jgi:hypothetical protein
MWCDAQRRVGERCDPPGDEPRRAALPTVVSISPTLPSTTLTWLVAGRHQDSAAAVVAISFDRAKRDMLRRKQREAWMSEDALIVITSAIKTAFIDHPGSGHGTTWDQITKSDEESIHLAKAVLIALRKAGYSVTKVEDR